jgi:aminoglycoside/choline kinase family phosphotransferase
MSKLQRQAALQQWLSKTFKIASPDLQIVSGDASFRRYFRFELSGCSAIAVDAPPSTEKNHQFVALAEALSQQGLAVPSVYAADLEDGFLCLQDLGSSLLEQQLTPSNAKQLYRQALRLIVQLQQTPVQSLPELERFDAAFIQRELDIFADWFVGQELALPDTWQQQADWSSLCRELSEAIMQQPYVAMHRDFHCRNLMLEQQRLVMIDFQDMVEGPICYDLVSLLRDCYVGWPESLVQDLSLEYFQHLPAPLAQSVSEEQWQRWFDLTGLQRHLKAIGIFCRLDHRDGKAAYRAAIPQTLSYALKVSAAYPELQTFHQWLASVTKGLSDELH